MSAVPRGTPDGDGERGDWSDDDWSEGDWSAWDELALLERSEREDRNWVRWAARLVLVAMILPLVLGGLVALMIWIF